MSSAAAALSPFCTWPKSVCIRDMAASSKRKAPAYSARVCGREDEPTLAAGYGG